ncbi:hypothetical protein BU25DRAFT_355258 [Macroventuria anomochaeta]|uniref:Uncharacterized protein n=1 Tax=Macroventuria anomochaeta TaxID=301207 RepID=A0ACB6SGT2_9PLEO|nr:uncharacterized protein BU25DRAFT_355258 [Macroventuria anomochaeta]KAF2633167.1 hypothetical protein BU25DRAFT_355258 [Macroventuria anomochaeta]
MSALEKLHEVMSARYDLVEDYDTDEVSVTSTDAGDEIFYNTDCIIAENPEEDACYLVKWEDYPLHECTWEPPMNLDGTDLISSWKQIRQELGEAAFQRENEKNIAAFEAAQERAEAAKERKYAKREKKRRRLQRRDRTVVPDDDSSDEEPLASVRTRTAAGDSLFVENQGPSVPATLVATRQPPVARKAPLQQSSSEDESNSDVQTSDDSLMGELRRNKRAQRKAERSAARSSTGNSLLQPKRPNTTTAPLEATSKTSTVREKSKQRSTVSAVSTKPTAERAHSTVVTTTSAMRAIRTVPQKQTSRAINIIDQPREQQRKAWSTDNHYNKLKYRSLAEKRSRTEGTPDFSALDFVNGPPPTLPKAAASRSSGDLYGRREITNRRVREEDPDDLPRQGLGEGSAPLADWEVDKVPLMCNAWKLSSNCPYGARKCRFMHRAFDPKGRPYQLGDYDGRIPHKYRKPPITCPFWYKGDQCKRTAEECLYAHVDTGWAEYNGQPIRIEHLPEASATSAARDVPPHLVPFKFQDPPITCSFWLRDPHGCVRSEEVCKYAHWNTGWTHEADIKGQPVRIDPTLKPRGGPPKYANPPVTCPFWLRSEKGCTRTAVECKYAHRNTGWAPPGMSSDQALPINPHELPRSQSFRNEPDVSNLTPLRTNSNDQGLIVAGQTVSSGPPSQANKGITCSSWLRDPLGCLKSEEACDYAHRNTGWATPKDRPFDSPVALDPNQIPRFHREQMGDRLEPKYGNPPVTCPSWLRNEDGCRKTEQECQFAHKNTGWAPQYGEGGGPAVEIDRKGKLRGNEPVRSFATDHSAPKNGTPPITCYFWLEGAGGCARTAETCRFAHRNTGWITYLGAVKNSHPEQINPKRLPRFRKYDPTENSSMPNGQSILPAPTAPSHSADEPGIDISGHTPADIVSNTAQASEQQLVQSPLAIEDVLPKQSLAAASALQLNAKIKQFYNLDITEMFHSGTPGDDEMLEKRAMLLYHPEEHPEDIELITRWLLMHEVKVGNLWYDGAWGQFQQETSKGKSGIIIVHPDFEQYVNLPGFGEVLKQRIRVWSVGLQPPPGFEVGVSSDPPELRHYCIGIFPHGGFIYITDDVFEQKPQLALSIVKLFFAKIEQLRSLDGPVSPWQEVDDACVLWRLCVRPELMEYLYLKCEDNSAELAAGNPDYLSRAELYQLLTLTNYMEQDHHIEPLSIVQDKYPILSERRVIAEHQPLDYFNRLANSQEDANTHMIGYYAAMQSADMRRAYRQFYVVHTEPEASCAQRWKASIQNIADVITPEQCIEELGKASKESLFDFLDWAMGPKEKKKGLDVVSEETEFGEAPMEIEPVEHTAY